MPRCNKLFLALLLFALAHSCNVSGQTVKKNTHASRSNETIAIDGKLDEPIWERAEHATGFIQNTPHPGSNSALETEVSIVYDDDAVYIGATMHDSSPDSILKQLTPRDEYDYNNTDAFGVVFDTYFDQQNGSAFVVTAAGVQADAKVKFDGFDYSWNAAWYSKVNIDTNGWTVEIKIPYSALRFPKTTAQKWGVNFFRTIRRSREKSFWNPVVPGVANFLCQTGTLENISEIKAPLRLALLPYVSAYGENYQHTNTKTLNGGLDVKYGINESFTLDMTLVPDFGQTLYDNKVLNLSPIEVKYDERRYFFTEGVDLFNKNDLFYSRRVGGTPVNSRNINSNLDSNEVVSKNPTSTRLYNATKISGRTKFNLGIGFFNAVSAATYATVTDTLNGKERQVQTAPLTNYNVVVLDQALKNNSYISFINTNVTRKENSYNADVAALLFKFANKSNTYGIDGSGDRSQIYDSTLHTPGYRYYLDIAKIKGNYTWSLQTNSISDKFNPNDLGYLSRNNIVTYSFNQSYNIYTPFWKANSFSNNMHIYYYRVYNPDVFQSLNINGSHYLTLKNYLFLGFYWIIQPKTTNDYYEPRTPGRVYLSPRCFQIGGYFSSDYRKKFALDGEMNNQWFATKDRNNFYWTLSPRYRFSDKFSMIYQFQVNSLKNDVGFVDNVNGNIYLGTRNVNTVTNTLSATYIFNNKMSLKLDARHYWSQAKYSKYSLLTNDGNLEESTAYTTNKNVNFNSFNIYTSYIWQFRPGSEISVVYQNIIISPQDNNIIDNYFKDVDYAFRLPQSNSLSVKVIYYLDYLNLKKSFKKSARS